VNAFNGDQSKIDSKDSKSTPQQMLTLPFSHKVLAFELTNETDELLCPFAKDYAGGKEERDLSAVLDKGLMGAFYSQSGKSRFHEMPAEYSVIKIAPGNLGLFDMVPDMAALTDMHVFNYNQTYRFLMGDINKPNGAKALEVVYGALREEIQDPRAIGLGSSYNSASSDERIAAKRNQYNYKRMKKIRDRLRRLL